MSLMLDLPFHDEFQLTFSQWTSILLIRPVSQQRWQTFVSKANSSLLAVEWLIQNGQTENFEEASFTEYIITFLCVTAVIVDNSPTTSSQCSHP
jgi:hypothetical protein